MVGNADLGCEHLVASCSGTLGNDLALRSWRIDRAKARRPEEEGFSVDPEGPG